MNRPTGASRRRSMNWTSVIVAAMGPLLASAAVAQAPSALEAPEAPAAATPLDSAQRARIVANIATAAETAYADAAAGARLARQLRDRLAAGAYDLHSDPAAFAAALTADLRAGVDDVHLRVLYEPGRAETGAARLIVAPGAEPGAQPGPAAGSGSGPQVFTRIDGRSRAAIARSNYGFERVERLAGNVGYLKLTRFVPLDYSANTAQAAMAFLANADAVIIDLRGVPGGSPDLVRLLLSYFAGAEPRRVMTTYNRAADASEEIWTLADVPGRRLTGRPLYILQDGDSASAAEMLAYGVQRLGLGRVVGETSAGAGNGGNMMPVGSGLSLFLPQRRITDGPGWEGTGISPDIAAPSANALAVAHAAALRQLVAQSTDPAERRDRERALELLEGRSTPVAATSAPSRPAA